MQQFEPFQFHHVLPGAPDKRDRRFVLQTYGKNILDEVQTEPLPPPPPTFSEEELRVAKEESYRKGFLDGESQGKSFAESEIAMIEKQTHALMQPVATQVLGMFSHYNQFVLQQKTMLPKLALAIACRASKKTMSEEALLHIESVAISCIERMLGEPELHIYVHSSLSDNLEEKLAKHFSHSKEPGDVIIHKNDNLIPGACRIEWKHGGLEYSPETFWMEMGKLMDRLAGAEMQTHEEINAENVLNTLETGLNSEHVEPQTNESFMDAATADIISDNSKE